MKKLKTLTEHNSNARNHNINSNSPVPNGIACPECGEELYDTNPMCTLTSIPPQKNVGCIGESGCGYSGYRIA